MADTGKWHDKDVQSKMTIFTVLVCFRKNKTGLKIRIMSFTVPIFVQHF